MIKEGLMEREWDWRRGAPGIWVDGGGVMSDEDRRGGERNFLFEDRSLAAALKSGEGDRVARRSGVAGASISAGAARGLGERRVF